MVELDEILRKYVNSTPGTIGSLQGAAFIVKISETLYSGAAGKLNFETDSPPFTEDAVGWIASMTKLVTAISAMQLLEKNLINLDDDVGKLIPQLSNMDILIGVKDGKPELTKQSKPITLRNLLTHSSGLGYDSFDPRLMEWSVATGRTVTNDSYTLEGYTIPLLFNPGDGWAYGIGLDWVGHLVSVITGLTFEDYVEKHILNPLGMSSTTFRIGRRPELFQRLATIAFRADPQGPLSPSDVKSIPDERVMEAGGEGLFSTANDYAKLVGALIQGGAGILQPESVRKLCEPQLPDTKYLMATFDSPFHDGFCCEYTLGTPANYGLGGAINLEDIPGKRRKGSLMWSGLSNPHLRKDPGRGSEGKQCSHIGTLYELMGNT